MPAPAKAATRAVTVQSWGQDSTLWGLAETHLGDGTRWGEIWSLNEGRRQQDGTVMRSPSFLRPGWTVLVPETPQHPSDAKQAARQAPAAGGSYTVASGDRLADIASRYLGEPEQYTRLQDLNRRSIPDANHIETGDQIRLPSEVRDRGSRPHARGTSPLAQRSDTTPASREVDQDAPNGHREPDDAATTAPRPAPSAEATGTPTRPNQPTPQPTSPGSSSYETTHASPTASTNSGSPGSVAEHAVDTPAGTGPLLGDVWQWALGLGGAAMAVLLLRRRRQRPDDYVPERTDSKHRRSTDRDGLELADTDDEEPWDDTDRDGGPRLLPKTAAAVRRPAIDQARAAIHQMAQNVPAAAPVRSAAREPSAIPSPEVVQVQTNSTETEQEGSVAPNRRVYVVKNAPGRPRNGAVPRMSPKPTAVRSADSIPPDANPIHLNAYPTAPSSDPGTLPLINGHQQDTQLHDKPRPQSAQQEQAEHRPRRPRHRAEPPRTTSESETAPQPSAHPSPAQTSPPDPIRPRSDQPHATPDQTPKTETPQTDAVLGDREATSPPDADWETKPPKNHTAAGSSNLHIRLFGAPAILDSNGTPVSNLRRQALALLLYLALHPEGASTSTLQEVLWPDATLNSAKKRFSTEISNLRRVIRAAAGSDNLSYDAVPAERGHYRLRPDLDVDLWTFTRALARAESDPEHREQHLRRAIAAQSGHLADDGTRYPWLTPHRTHLSRQRAKAKRALAALIQNEKPEEAAALIAQADQAEASLGPPRQHRPDQANSHRSPENP
nr:LysM peptidoglycan-binding domain-containing protein [Kineosporia rhizophila]